jgi:hypothetical protein
VDEPGEQPDREEPERHQGMELEADRRLGHQGSVGPEREERPVPDRHAFAVVVLPADGEDRSGDGVPHAQDDRKAEEEVHDLVHDCGRREHRPGRAAPVDQDAHADHCGDAGQQAADDRDVVVEL